jgi:MOSC domain-containing protein YiiM
MAGTVVSVNVSPVRTRTYGGTSHRTAIGKQPVADRVTIEALGCAGDAQADHRYHGGPERAVYAYAAEDYAWWSERLGRPLSPGIFGENLTLAGIDVTGASIGERWRAGSVVFAVTAPRVPCSKLGMAMEDPTFVKAFAEALRPGAYLRVIEGGTIAAGDPVEVIARPAHDISVAAMADIQLFDRARIPDALAISDLPEFLREWALDHQP